MAIPELIPSQNNFVDIQETDLSIDVLGRFACNTLDEALSSGSFDVIVIGSGMYGGYCAAKINKLHPNLRVLVLEAGPFLISEHVQNLSRIGYGIFDSVSGQPYIATPPNEAVNHYYCVGGKSLGWGKWSPRLHDSDLALWPNVVAQYLRDNYPLLEEEIGVQPRSEFIFGELADEFEIHLANTLPANPNFDDLSSEIAPIAAQAAPLSPGLYCL